MKAALLLAAVALSACFQERTNYRSGEVACNHGDGSCPPGLVCALDHLCYRTGELPTIDAPLTFADARLPDAAVPKPDATPPPPDAALPTADAPPGCVPLIMCPDGDECGTVDPGCSMPPLPCGSGACPVDRPTCANNKCICVPLAVCPTGACSTHPNGCGGTLQCGACANNQACDSGTSLCRDKSQAEACDGFTCGTVPTGSTSWSCGSCASPQQCTSASGGSCTCGDPCAGLNCGTFSDFCGNPVDCDPGHTCNIGLCFECDSGICTFRTQCQ